jgi:DNA-binding NtrC family response regulator
MNAVVNTAANKSVLVVDDEAAMRLALQANFQQQGWEVETAGGAAEALRKFQQKRFPLVVTDVRMPDGDGFNVMRSVRMSAPETAVIILTAFGSVPDAVQAMRGGACDYLSKPISFEQLQGAVTRVMGRRESARADNFRQLDQPAQGIIGSSLVLTRTLERARHAARTSADVLIEAESGTGKELLARYIHEASDRRERPFIAVNCAALPEHLLESELFGHARGAFTGANAAKAGKFELAQGGTLLLDEIGEMPLGLQPKLLRALQEREFERLGETRTVRVNIRVIATTNLLLLRMVEEGSFRADLYYRLNVVPLSLPPLRDRREDIPALAEFFTARFAPQAGRGTPSLHPEFVAGLQKQDWPGNIRELGNFMRRILALSEDAIIGPEFLGPEFLTPAPQSSAAPGVAVRPGTAMREMERRLLESTLEVTNGNRTRAAEMLGISLRTIRNKIREFGLPPRRYEAR